MVVRELTAAEHAHKALDLLTEAYADLKAGEYDSASGKLWGAVEHALVAVATERGRECEGGGYLELRPAVEWLGEEDAEDGILIPSSLQPCGATTATTTS